MSHRPSTIPGPVIRPDMSDEEKQYRQYMAKVREYLQLAGGSCLSGRVLHPEEAELWQRRRDGVADVFKVLRPLQDEVSL